MSENLELKEYMKEDAFAFDNLSKQICQKENSEDYKQLLTDCKKFESSVVLFSIVPTFYVMKTILYFKLNDYENANKYINASLKYLLYIAKNGSIQSEKEQENFEEYKENVLNQYKILTQDKPEYLNAKRVALPFTAKFITCNDDNIIQEEQNLRLIMRKNNINRKTALNQVNG